VKFAGTTDEAASAVLDAPAASHEARTRDRIARSILESGPSTASVLAARVGLTATAVRRHLDALLADGLIEEREPRTTAARGRGRPARLFGVTDAGRDSFDQDYDDLAASALAFLEQHSGREAVAAFARQRVAELEARYRPVVERTPDNARTEALAAALSGDGYAATTQTATGPGGNLGEQLCQHHCPVAHVAEKYPELCEAETQAFGRLLGTHVQRLATIAHGDGVCTTYVPRTTTLPSPAHRRTAQ
jgi:predicted ArsR family transcriptional regulator